MGMMSIRLSAIRSYGLFQNTPLTKCGPQTMRLPRIVIVAVTLGICLAGILFWLGLRNAPQKRDEIWFEVAKAGLQLGVVAIIGAGIAASRGGSRQSAAA